MRRRWLPRYHSRLKLCDASTIGALAPRHEQHSLLDEVIVIEPNRITANTRRWRMGKASRIPHHVFWAILLKHKYRKPLPGFRADEAIIENQSQNIISQGLSHKSNTKPSPRLHTLRQQTDIICLVIFQELLLVSIRRRLKRPLANRTSKTLKRPCYPSPSAE